MTNQISLPDKINVVDQKDNHYQVTIEPFYPGFGVTIGNALRRVLLSSLPGGAVTSFKINGVQHEFDAIPGVKEDVVEIMLNLKQLRLKSFSDEPVKLKLSAKGENILTAGDIDKNSEVEISNKDLVICTLTDKTSNMDMEITVENGLGYVTVEQREKEKLDIGTIAIDSSFSPIMNVGYNVENVRVGKMTNYEKLILDIITDGTITAEESISQASILLENHFNIWATKEEEVKPKAKKSKKEKEEVEDKEESE